MKLSFQLVISIVTLSVLFSYENKFSYVNTMAGIGKVSLEHVPEITDRMDGYTRLVTIGEGHTTFEGMPELPEFTTFYQLHPSLSKILLYLGFFSHL